MTMKVRGGMDPALRVPILGILLAVIGAPFAVWASGDLSYQMAGLCFAGGCALGAVLWQAQGECGDGLEFLRRWSWLGGLVVAAVLLTRRYYPALSLAVGCVGLGVLLIAGVRGVYSYRRRAASQQIP